MPKLSASVHGRSSAPVEREMATPRLQAAGELVHLRGTWAYRISDGQTDVRGWSVWDADGRRVGRVVDLVIDTALLRVQYAEVRPDGARFRARTARARLEPISAARLDHERRALILPRRASPDGSRTPVARGSVGRTLTLGTSLARTGVIHVCGPTTRPGRARHRQLC